MNPLNGYNVEDLAVGQTAGMAKTVTEADIILFSGVSTDVNPVHLDEEWARTTMFKGRIAHGMLSVGFISAVLANKLPGPGCVYLGQTLRFKSPVRPGDTVRAVVTVKDINVEKKRVVLTTNCFVGETTVIEGEATVLCTTARP